MKVDPRNPPSSSVARTDSTHEAHDALRKTLVCLKIDGADGPIFFVVEGLSHWGPLDEMLSSERYFYEEHTCPTNFIRIPLIVENGDMDPHGVFEFVDAVWMTDEYLMAVESGGEHEYLARVFPQLGINLDSTQG